MAAACARPFAVLPHSLREAFWIGAAQEGPRYDLIEMSFTHCFLRGRIGIYSWFVVHGSFSRYAQLEITDAISEKASWYKK